MKIKILSILLLLIIITSSLQTSFASPIDLNVPPTRAFAKISNGTNHVMAKNYLGQLNVTSGGGIGISVKNGTNGPSLIITNTAASGISKIQGKNLGTSGTGIFAGNFNASMLQFLSFISANSNCLISSNSTNIILNCSTGGSSTFDTMHNIGIGQGSVYAGNTTKTNFQFKTIKAGSNISITNNTNDVTINSLASNGTNGRNGTNGTNGSNGSNGINGKNGTNATAVYDTLQNIGSGQASIYAGNNTKTNFQIKTLTATGSSSLINGSSLITIYTHTYQNNTATNIGHTGKGIFSAMNGAVINLRNMTSSRPDLITISANVTDLTFSSTFKSDTKNCGAGFAVSAFDNTTGIYTCIAVGTGSGTITTASNIGHGGQGLFSSVSGSTIQLRNITSLRSDLFTVAKNITDVILSSNFKSNSITCTNQFISAFSNSTGLYTCSTGNSGTITSGTNVGKGTTSAGVYSGVSGSILQFKNVTAGTGISLAKNTTDITITSTITQGYNAISNIGKGGFGILKTSGNTLQGKNITSTDTHLTVSSNSTDVNLSTSGLLSSAIISSQNVGKGTNSLGVLSAPTSTLIKGKNMTAGAGITLSGNTTDITITNKSYLPNINFTSPSNPSTTASTTGVMSNLFATFTPTVTGRILVTVCGQMQSATAGDGAKFDVRYGTSLISEGTAIGNTVVGTTKGITSSTLSQPNSACNSVQITGLILNQKIYIQIGKYAVVGGTATFANFNVSIIEI